MAGQIHAQPIDPDEKFIPYLKALPEQLLIPAWGQKRLLADGRFILAGSQSHLDVVEATDIACNTRTCPKLYLTVNGTSNSYRHIILDTKTGVWKYSASSTGRSQSAVIRANGQVVSLGEFSVSLPVANPKKYDEYLKEELHGDDASIRRHTDYDDKPYWDTGFAKKYYVIEASTPAGNQWKEWPFPKGVKYFPMRNYPYENNPPYVDSYHLLLGEHPKWPNGRVFFLLTREIRKNSYTEPLYSLWAWSDSSRQWQSFFSLLDDQTIRRKPIPLADTSLFIQLNPSGRFVISDQYIP